MATFYIILAIILSFTIVWLIDKYDSKKYKKFILTGLWAIIIFLFYSTFMSVYGEIQFNTLNLNRHI